MLFRSEAERFFIDGDLLFEVNGAVIVAVPFFMEEEDVMRRIFIGSQKT